MTMVPKATDIGKTQTGEFDNQRLPIFTVKDWPDEYDQRVELPDGSLAYAIEDSAGDVGLYLEAMAVDAGDNVLRRFRASDCDIAGITAPTGPGGSRLFGQRDQLHCIGAEQVGWLRSK
jgi:hypothetical protein